MARVTRKPRGAAAHLNAITAQRMEWTEADRLLAAQLAELRAQLDAARAEARKAPLTVPTGSGSTKPNPVHAAVDRLARQEASLTRRLGLGLKRAAGGQYETRSSPLETRQKLWEKWGSVCTGNLMPGVWLHVAREAGVEIPEDSLGWPENPSELPVSGVH